MNFYDDLIAILNLNSTFITFQFTAISNKLSSTDEFILNYIRFIFSYLCISCKLHFKAKFHRLHYIMYDMLIKYCSVVK